MKQPTVLIIEDDPMLRHTMGYALKDKFVVLEAFDGEEGIALAKEHHPELIVCDIGLPVLDGYQVLHTIRQDAAMQNTPFILVSAFDERDNIRQGMQLGADDYLTKPFSLEELRSAVHTQIKKKSKRDASSHLKMETLRHNLATALPHELRTPLMIIGGYTNLLIEDEARNNEPLRAMLEPIQQSAQRLERIIENFLLYARLETTDQTTVDPLDCDICKITRIPNVLEQLAGEKAAQYNRQNDLVLGVIETDIVIHENDFSKIIEEVVDNAFKFSNPDTPVYIFGMEDAGMLILHITNSGRGMTESEINRVGAYMQFRREQYEQQGVGLGLAIARLLAEKNNGKLTITSIPDQEITVDIRLPLAR